MRRLLTQAVQENAVGVSQPETGPSVPTPADEAVDVTPTSPSEIPTQQELGDESSPAAFGQAQPMAPQHDPVRATPLPSPLGQAAGVPVPLLHVPLRLVGVVGKLYVVLESDKGLGVAGSARRTREGAVRADAPADGVGGQCRLAETAAAGDRGAAA